jgi:hypothetical protein
VNFAALLIVLPRYGILGAAWVTSALMVLNRGLYAAWLVSRQLDYGYARYLWSIYARPAACAAPVLALLFGLKSGALAGRNWTELFAAAAIAGAAHLALAFFICLDREHRALLSSGAIISTRFEASSLHYPVASPSRVAGRYSTCRR